MTALAIRQQRLDVRQIQHRRGVALGIFGVGVTFEEQAIDARGYRCAGEHRAVLRVAAGLVSQAGGLLRAVCDIKHDRMAEAFHHGQRGEIVD